MSFLYPKNGLYKCKAKRQIQKTIQEVRKMAIEKSVESVGMKVTVNHGEKEGKIVKSSKTYGDVDPAVTDEAFVGTAKAITGMQELIREKQVKVTAEEIVEIA